MCSENIVNNTKQLGASVQSKGGLNRFQKCVCVGRGKLKNGKKEKQT